MLYIRAPELIQLIAGSLYPLTNVPISPTPQPLATTILFAISEFGFFRFHTYMRQYSICVSLSYFT